MIVVLAAASVRLNRQVQGPTGATSRAIGPHPPREVAENRATHAGTSDARKFESQITGIPILPAAATLRENHRMKIHGYKINQTTSAANGRLLWSTRRSNPCSAMRFFKISTEPPAIIQPRVRRMQYSTSVSRENPLAAMICTASLATSKPAWLHATLAMAVS